VLERCITSWVPEQCEFREASSFRQRTEQLWDSDDQGSHSNRDQKRVNESNHGLRASEKV